MHAKPIQPFERTYFDVRLSIAKMQVGLLADVEQER
jgi:hypothetical protein